jgi:iron complex outermembrane receptor protein
MRILGKLSPLAVLAGATALTPLLATPALGQNLPQSSNTAESDSRIEEIVVTAQKRAENVQDVPISITAVSAEELRNRSVSQLSDLQSATPNVTFSTTAQGTLASTVGIRGLRNSNIELVNDQPAAIYIDDVYQSTAIGSMSFLGPDVERVEVLRGPQGTLFGRNTIGGAVSVHTKRPQLDDFNGRLMVGAGNHGLVEGQGMLNIPLLKDAVALRFNLGYRDDNGFAKETTYGRRLGQSKQVYARGQLRFRPSDRLDINITGDYVDARTDGNLLQPVFLTVSHPAFVSPFNPVGFSPAYRELGLNYLGRFPTLADADAVQSQFFSCGGGPRPTLQPRCWSPSPTNPRTTTGPFFRAATMGDISVYREWGFSGNIEYELADDLQVKSITAYRDFYHDSPKDYDGAQPILLWSRATPEGNTFTQELQLNGNVFDDRLKYTLGSYYYRFKGIERGTNTAVPALTTAFGLADTVANYLENRVDNKSLGFFGQTTFAVTDRLNLTGGLRYTKENKKVGITQFGSRSITPATPNGLACTLPIPPAGSNADPALCIDNQTLKYDSWDWTVGADYKPTDDIMIYARAAKGFQAGGINQRSTVGVPFVKYLPMTAINYEIGAKADLLDRILRINVSAFQTDVKDYQRPVPATFFVNGTAVAVVATINAATVRIRGLEGEVTLIPFEGARISAQIGLTDPKYKKFLATGPGGPNTLDLSQSDFQQISKVTYGISPSYTLPVEFGEIHFQLDYVYQSRQNLQPALAFPRDQELPVPGMIQKGYGLLNGRVAARVGEDTEIAVWGKNITDKRYFTGGLNLAGSLGFANATVGNPRTFGIQISHNF